MAGPVQWNESMQIHVFEIDMEHKQLVDLANAVYEASRGEGAAAEVEKRALVTLIDYVKTHFATEKRLMAEYGYPDREAHQARHAEFTEKLADLCRRHQLEKKAVIGEILSFLVGWIINHIMAEDRRLGEFLNEKGVR